MLSTWEMRNVMPPRQTLVLSHQALPAAHTEARASQFEPRGGCFRGSRLPLCRSSGGGGCVCVSVSLGSPVPLLARLTLHTIASFSPNFTPVGHHVANED